LASPFEQDKPVSPLAHPGSAEIPARIIAGACHQRLMIEQEALTCTFIEDLVTLLLARMKC
jgi:hypothetical protein